MLDAVKLWWKVTWQFLSGSWFFLHGWFDLLRGRVWRYLRPVGYLWPWLIADGIFIGYLVSSQGIALAMGLTGQTWMRVGTLAILVLSLTCTVASMLFTSLVVTSHEASRLSGAKMRVHGARQLARAMSMTFTRELSRRVLAHSGRKLTTQKWMALNRVLVSVLEQNLGRDEELMVPSVSDLLSGSVAAAMQAGERDIDKLADLATSALPHIGILPRRDLEGAEETAGDEATDGRGSGRLHVAWALFLAFMPVVALLLAANSLVGWLLMLVLVAVVVALLAFGLKGTWADAKAWQARMRRLYNRRSILAVVVAAAAVLPLALGAAWVTQDSLAPVQFGPLFVAMVGLAGLSSLVGTTLIAIPYCVWHPWYLRLGLFILVALNLSFFPRADLRNPLLRDQAAQVAQHLQADENCDNPSRRVSGELEDRAREIVRTSRAGGTPAMRFVSADGGGIRAAYWTAMGLVQMGEAVEGFEPSIATLSGVSGGSLGIATWLAAVETAKEPAEQRRLVAQFLGSDFLSPAVTGMLFLDAPRLLFGFLWWPAIRRDHVFEAAIVERWAQVAGPNSDFFLRPVRRMCLRAFGAQPPLVFFNATEALLGAYVASGNTQTALPGGGRKYINTLMPESTLLGSTVVEAVMLSARFPFLSAAADIGVRERSVQRLMSGVTEPALPEPELLKELAAPDQTFLRLGVLVDGGFFDNSGITTTREMLALLDWNSREGRHAAASTQVSAHVIHFSNDPQGSCVNPGTWRDAASSELKKRADDAKFEPVCLFEVEELESLLSRRPFSWLTSPLEAIFAVRSGHAAHEVRHVSRLVLARRVPGTLVNFSLASELTSKLCESRSDPVECSRRAGLGERARGYAPITAGAQATDAAQANCRAYDKPSTLPLGWALSEDDKELLGCLAISAALRAKKELASGDSVLRAATVLSTQE